ncbi:MAG: hypothetical protein F6K26_34235 [Moorea sp. SIO2I5]|nr:hypothetical protein [Moorena sp. SIO2I5]
MRASWRVNRPWVAPVEWASCVEAMQRGLGGFPHERLHQDTGILPVSCLFSRGQDARSTPVHSKIQQRHFFPFIHPTVAEG